MRTRFLSAGFQIFIIEAGPESDDPIPHFLIHFNNVLAFALNKYNVRFR
jgi:hypothetical protein